MMPCGRDGVVPTALGHVAGTLPVLLRRTGRVRVVKGFPRLALGGTRAAARRSLQRQAQCRFSGPSCSKSGWEEDSDREAVLSGVIPLDGFLQTTYAEFQLSHVFKCYS